MFAFAFGGLLVGLLLVGSIAGGAALAIAYKRREDRVDFAGDLVEEEADQKPLPDSNIAIGGNRADSIKEIYQQAPAEQSRAMGQTVFSGGQPNFLSFDAYKPVSTNTDLRSTTTSSEDRKAGTTQQVTTQNNPGNTAEFSKKVITGEIALDEVAYFISTLQMLRFLKKPIAAQAEAFMKNTRSFIVWRDSSAAQAVYDAMINRLLRLRGLSTQGWTPKNSGIYADGQNNWNVPNIDRSGCWAIMNKAYASDLAFELGSGYTLTALMEVKAGNPSTAKHIMGTVTGAISQAVSGAIAGSTLPGWGTAVGAITGFLKGLGEGLYNGIDEALQKAGKEEALWGEIVGSINDVKSFNSLLWFPLADSGFCMDPGPGFSGLPKPLSLWVQRAPHQSVGTLGQVIYQGAYPGVGLYVYNFSRSVLGTLDHGDRVHQTDWQSNPNFR